MNIQTSLSEDHGINILVDSDLEVYSVGISTGGVAEIRMAGMNPARHIIATTIDEAGVKSAEKYFAESHVQDQIEAKIEDIAQPLQYPDDHFDYVYARLVLHYLPKDKLTEALHELHRVLKPGGKLFVVVRSTKCPDATREDAQLDPVTGLTTCTSTDEKTGRIHSYSRFFHTEESIHAYVSDAGFKVSYVKAYDEQLFVDFMRTELSPKTDNLIELLAIK